MSLDIFMSTLARAFSYVLPIVGVIALIYMILFLKQLIETLKQVSKTLDTARSIEKTRCAIKNGRKYFKYGG